MQGTNGYGTIAFLKGKEVPCSVTYLLFESGQGLLIHVTDIMLEFTLLAQDNGNATFQIFIDVMMQL
ncbi:hypothetical protein D3C74_429010 [compost metagenome]